jgi:hypothetical protein
MQWLDGLGDSAISPTNPLTKTQPVNPDGSVTTGGSAAMSGFTILEAESIDAALVAARSCPFLETGGSLEASELMQMPG